MADLRITASLMFALEMTRAVLAQQELIPGTDLTSPLGEMDIDFNSQAEDRGIDLRKFYLTFRVRGVEHVFAFNCHVRRTENGWTEGGVIIDSLPSSIHPSAMRFKCKLENNRLVTNPW